MSKMPSSRQELLNLALAEARQMEVASRKMQEHLTAAWSEGAKVAQLAADVVDRVKKAADQGE